MYICRDIPTEKGKIKRRGYYDKIKVCEEITDKASMYLEEDKREIQFKPGELFTVCVDKVGILKEADIQVFFVDTNYMVIQLIWGDIYIETDKGVYQLSSSEQESIKIEEELEIKWKTSKEIMEETTMAVGCIYTHLDRDDIKKIQYDLAYDIHLSYYISQIDNKEVVSLPVYSYKLENTYIDMLPKEKMKLIET